MRDDGSMDILEVIDEAFGGAIDPRELVSKMNDPSEVHVNGPVKVSAKAKAERRKKRELEVGLANNALGAGAGTIATVQARRAWKASAAAGEFPATRIGRALSRTKIHPGKAIAIAGAANVGLQAANGALDAQSAGYFGRERVKMEKDKVRKSLNQIIGARRLGAITTEQAVEMAGALLEEVEKGLTLPKLPKLTLRPSKAARQKELEKAVDEVVPTGKKLLAGAAIAAGAGGSAAAGAKGQRMLDQKRQQNQAMVAKSLDVEWSGTVSKFDTDKRLVFGWCSVSKVDGKPVVDLQGDYVPIETTEDAAYKYVVHSRKGGDMHRRIGKGFFDDGKDQPLHTADLVESFVVTPEKLEALGLAPDAMPLGWWVGFKVNDDQQWADFKAGKRPAFSIHGSGQRVHDPELAHL